MPKKTPKTDSFVTQSQWAEGMEMIKDFFGKLVAGNEEIKDRVGNLESSVEIIKNRVGNLESNVEIIKDRVGTLEQTTEEMKKNIEMNTDSLSLLTKDLHETQKLEHDIFNHEQRITKLEKVR